MFRILHNIYIALYNMCCFTTNYRTIRYSDILQEVEYLNDIQRNNLIHHLTKDRCCY